MSKNSSQVLDNITKFIKDHIIGNDHFYDSLPELPLPVYKKFHELGCANWWLDQKFGGLGINLSDSVDIVTALAYGDAGLAFTFFISILGTTPVTAVCSEELQNEILGSFVEKGLFCGTSGSEFVAGSELTKITTVSKRSGDAYTINGSKSYCTNADFAEYILVITKATQDEMSFRALIVPRNTPGLTIVKRWSKLGVRSSGTYELQFKNCSVPARYALNMNGIRVLEFGLNTSRILIAASAIGIAKRIRDHCLEYAESKILKNSKLIRNHVFAAKMGQMEMQIEAMNAVCRNAAKEYDDTFSDKRSIDFIVDNSVLKSAVIAKLFCGQIGWQIATEASTMFGGHGYTNENLIGKLIRDMRYISIIEGGDDVLRDLLYAKYVVPDFYSRKI